MFSLKEFIHCCQCWKTRICWWIVFVCLWTALTPVPMSGHRCVADASTTTTTTTTTETNNNDNDHSYFLLCLTDGSIYNIQAWTGEYQSTILTDPLMSTTHLLQHPSKSESTTNPEKDTDETIDGSVIPGLDGRLYWRPPPSNTFPNDNPSQDLEPLQELPLTVQSLLENPVRSCSTTTTSTSRKNDNTEVPLLQEDCGIITAEAVTSIIAVSAESGQMVWNTHPATTTTTSKTSGSATTTAGSSSTSSSVLLLQRKDYWVQHIRTATGQQLWNVSLGTYQALDFDSTHESSTSASSSSASSTSNTILLDNDEDDTNNQDDTTTSNIEVDDGLVLPAILFSDDGYTITAIGSKQKQILWRLHVPSMLAAVFGVAQGKWQSVLVVPSTPNDMQETDTTLQQKQSQQYNDILPALLHETNNQQQQRQKDQYYERFLWAQYQQRQEQQWNQLHLDSQDETLLRISSSQEMSQQDNCWSNGKLTSVSCPNLYVQQQLRLPSSSSSTRPVIVQEGILLSWSFVVAIGMVLVTIIAGGRFWYIHKKAQWLSINATISRRRSRTLSSSSSQSSNNDDNNNDPLSHNKSNKYLKRSNSLPGVLGTPDPLQMQRLFKSDDAVQLSSDTPTIPPPPRYSRYASEFVEVRDLGKGGFGSVFECRNTLDGRSYAIKKVIIRGGTNHKHFQQQLQRVLREVKILAVLDHPNIVRYYTAWLEIDESKKPDLSSANDQNMKNGSSTLSHCYSSSLLLGSDSVSGWDLPPQQKNLKNTYSSQHYNPILGQTQTCIEFETSDDSWNPERKTLQRPSFEYLKIFEEDSKEENDASTSTSKQLPSETLTVSHHQDISVEGRSLLSLGNERDSFFAGNTDTDLQQKAFASTTSATEEHLSSTTTMLRHTLYIQMQLCSHKTVAEFLDDSEARRGLDGRLDMIKALRLFLQIAEAVKHVHGQGLIHRDLKPSNCFMEDSTIKVGDFGLSRESTISDSGGTDEKNDNSNKVEVLSAYSGSDEYNYSNHTAGVGTRSYASPEQMKGSDYDSSTDVYSLGIMLFEILYPMYTGMERNICLSRLRDNKSFPNDWEDSVGRIFPTMKGLITAMLSESPLARPSAKSVASHIQSVLGEFTILSLDTRHCNSTSSDLILLRVESEHHEDALRNTMQLIRDLSKAIDGTSFEIVQYGLRSASTATTNNNGTEPVVAIMEFALKSNSTNRSTDQLVEKLSAHPHILKARQLSGGAVSFIQN